MTRRLRRAMPKTLSPAEEAVLAAAPGETAAAAPVEAGAPPVGPVSSGGDGPDGVPEAGDDFIAVRVVDAAMVLPNPNPFLILEEIAPPHRRLTIPIGLAEGTAIGFALRGQPTPKPLTHELFVNLVARLGGSIAAARITGCTRGAFYAEVAVETSDGQVVAACRPSDAVALALRQGPAATVAVVSALLDQLGRAGSAGG